MWLRSTLVKASRSICACSAPAGDQWLTQVMRRDISSPTPSTTLPTSPPTSPGHTPTTWKYISHHLSRLGIIFFYLTNFGLWFFSYWHIYMYICTYLWMDVCNHVQVCMYEWNLYVSNISVYVCMCVCLSTHLYVFVCLLHACRLVKNMKYNIPKAASSTTAGAALN